MGRTKESVDQYTGAILYNVVRGEVKNIRDLEAFFHLGPISCLTTSQFSTEGSEDLELPPVGGAFFYLVEYNSGFPSGYGTVSAAKERFAPPGQGTCP